METKAGMSREAWGQSMDATDRRRQRAILDLLEMDRERREEMRELRAVDRARHQQIIQTLTVMQTLQREMIPLQGLVTIMQGHVIALQGQVMALQGQVTASQGQQGPAGGPAQLELPEEADMIDQGVTAALAARDATRNGVDSHTSGTGVRGSERIARECTYQDFMKLLVEPDQFLLLLILAGASTHGEFHVMTVTHDVAYAMTWVDLRKKMTDKYCPRNEMKKLKAELWNLKVIVQGHFRKECPKLKNNKGNRGNQDGRDTAPAKVYAVGRAGTNDSNVVMGMFLLNNCYASVLFDTGADRSFVSTAFSSQMDIMPSTLDHYYDVELADGRIIGLNTILRGCTLNLLNHPFNINLMPVELGSFDAIIGMDWLAKYQAIIVCAEKIVQYMLKGCPVFLAHVTTNEVEDKSEKKRLEDVPIVRDFLEVFPEDLPGLPPT
ncbi:putative reverse transcriptase domain-containing protein [Tanacetum coccineum]